MSAALHSRVEEGIFFSRAHGYCTIPPGCVAGTTVQPYFLGSTVNAAESSAVSCLPRIRMFPIIVPFLDATTFNFVSDLVGDLTRLLLASLLGFFYSILISLHVHDGKTIPLQLLGSRGPDNTIAALLHSKLLGCSVPAIAMLGLLLIADFAHSAADLGLDFTGVEFEGPLQPVLSLSRSRRNEDILFETVGDPQNIRVGVAPATALNTSVANPAIEESLRLVNSFTTAVDSIAKGTSPFLNAPATTSEVTEDQKFPGAILYIAKQGEPLASINTTLALSCGSSTMVPVEQVLFIAKTFNTALVPDCDFSGQRLSGIFPNDGSSESVQVTASLWSYFSVEGQRPSPITFITDPASGWPSSSMESVFVFPQQFRSLALDRPDWQRGRRVNGITGMKYESVELTFNSVVLSNAGEGEDSFVPVDGNQFYIQRRTHYNLVAEVSSSCPSRESDGSSLGDECIALITLNCDAFPEDYSTLFPDPDLPLLFDNGVDILADRTCEVRNFNMIWGTGIGIDEGVVVALAGVLGRSRPGPQRDSAADLILEQNALLAALFLIGNIETRAEAIVRIRAQISLFYVVLMLLPLALSLSLFIIVLQTYRNRLKIPESATQVLSIGREHEDLLNPRVHWNDNFPDLSNELLYGFHDDESSERKKLGLFKSASD